MKRACIVLFFLLFTSFSAAASSSDAIDSNGGEIQITSWTQFPELIQSFRKSILADPDSDATLQYLQFPVTLREIAYGGYEECGYYERTRQISTTKETRASRFQENGA